QGVGVQLPSFAPTPLKPSKLPLPVFRARSNQHIEVNPLKVEVVNTNSCQRAVSIEVDPESLKPDHSAVCNKYQRQARVPGFRQGKTPMSLILQRYKNEIREDFLEASVQKHLLEAIKSEKLQP